MRRGMIFSTSRNNYFYDDTTGNVELYNGNLDNETELVIQGSESYVHEEVSLETIEYYLHKEAAKMLTLIVSEDCNFRCEYCVFSDNYAMTREHTKNSMSSEVALEAVSKYLNHFKNYNGRNLLSIPKICFFGGEPLMNFGLIKEVVKHVQNIYDGNIIYMTTTNGSLLSKSKIDFMVENNFYISVSLNGYREEHDRLRVYIGNRGTYDDIIANLRYIKNNYSEYYQNNISFINIYDTGTNLELLKEFYASDELFTNKLSKLSPVIDIGTDWYEQYSKEEKDEFNIGVSKIIKGFLSDIKEGCRSDEVSRSIFRSNFFNVMNRPINVPLKDTKFPFLPYTSTCMPGMKVIVGVNGLIHCCEKINEKMPIGTVDSWIDSRKIRKIVNDYNESFGPHCINCPIQRMCEVCYQHFLDADGKFDLTKREAICNRTIDQKMKILTIIYEQMEDGLEFNDLLSAITQR
ncbi:radical SAM protein [Paenibacillus piscarius]|uniref:radical SAM protein n=1 Tax=Paenibacillus piscarius TaxID=1089681 RepID=UPI001EE7E9ED|nr:radical SAM protein [Paenibacillus piscarius]